MKRLIFIVLLLVFYSCKNEDRSTDLPWKKELPISTPITTQIINSNLTLDVMGVTCLVYSKSDIDSIAHPMDTNIFFASLPLGHRYVLGFKKEGYIQKHLIVDVIKTGTLENSRYGFEFPMELHLIPGDVNLPSKLVGQLEYIDSIGDIDNVLNQ